MASLLPIRTLTGKTDRPASRIGSQKLLIVGQYAVSIALVAGSFVIYEQLVYVQDKGPGYDRENVVTVQVRDPSISRNYESIRDEWLNDPRVVAVTSSRSLPTHIESSTEIRGWEGSTEHNSLQIYLTESDYDFIEVFGIELVAGRSFACEIASDTLGACLINEKAASAFGWTPEEAIGKHVTRSGEERANTIVGVVKDFHMHSMRLPVKPLMIYLNPGWMSYISARVLPGDLPATIKFMDRAAKRFSPFPFDFQFLVEQYDALYREDRKLGETFSLFTFLALLIASLGLFGLAAYSSE